MDLPSVDPPVDPHLSQLCYLDRFSDARTVPSIVLLCIVISFVSLSFFDTIFSGFGILWSVNFFVLSEKCNSISSNVRPSVSGKILYSKIQPHVAKIQLNNVYPGNDSVVSKLKYDLMRMKLKT